MIEHYKFLQEIIVVIITKVSEQIKRHFYLDILKIQIEFVPIFQC